MRLEGIPQHYPGKRILVTGGAGSPRQGKRLMKLQ